MRAVDSSFTDPLFADQHTIETPEQVALNLPVASVGSRLLALLADSLLQGVVMAGVVLILFLLTQAVPHRAAQASAASGDVAKKWVAAGFILVEFLLFWGYFSLFEAFGNGQTPGKRLMRLRVLADSGRPITLFESLTRNLIRVIDMIPSFYLVGLIAVLSNNRAKRLGDLLAGTIVVHESALPRAETATATSRLVTPAPAATQAPVISPGVLDHGIPQDALARVTSVDRQVLERYFSRNLDLAPAVRHSVAASISTHLAARMQWTRADRETHPERMLEAVQDALSGR